jgi:pimeloyl-ACP methyl ester carboxylesterase
VSNLAMTSKLPPLVLLHGAVMSGDAWQEAAPLLAARHDVYAPSALGHRGGPAVQRRSPTIWDVVDASERYLDEKGLDKPHLAGLSMGGFVALELARRGRAMSVCAFSPGGFWSDDFRMRAEKKGRRGLKLVRHIRPILPLVMKSALLRRQMMRDSAVHGERISAERAMETIDDALECTIVHDIDTADEHVALMDPLPCPITIAWAEKDRVIPVEIVEAVVRERLPRATFTVLPDVGHMAMLDDPELVASTILAVTGALAKH